MRRSKRNRDEKRNAGKSVLSTRDSDLFEFGIETKKVAENVQFAAERVDILADEVESSVAGAPRGQAQRHKITILEIGFNAVLREPTIAETAANGVNGRLN